MWNIDAAQCAFLDITILWYCQGEPIPQKELGSSLFRVLLCVCGEGLAGENYSSMIPLFMPIMAACVRSLAPNLERMDLTRLLTVSSVILS
jgi:hypothetical protein